jgi:hypothetical protein
MLPCCALSRVTQKVHDNGALLNGLIDLKEICAGNPAILLSLLPASTVFPHTNDDIEPVVAKVQSLAMALRAVADESESIILEVVKELVTRPVVSL